MLPLQTIHPAKTSYRKGLSCKAFFTLFMMSAILLMLPANPLQAQEGAEPETEVRKPHSPTRAAIFSAVLPGLGQAYNRKYWKIPIVYAGFGLITYFVIRNSGEYKKYKEAYAYVARGDSVPIDNDYVTRYDEEQLLDAKNYYRRNMELSYILGGLWYIMNIIDASVDAHFFDYDISEDLSVRLDPVMHVRRTDQKPVSGIRLTLNF